MCFSIILSRVLHKCFVYIPPTPLSNGPSVNKVLSCLVKAQWIGVTWNFWHNRRGCVWGGGGGGG